MSLARTLSAGLVMLFVTSACSEEPPMAVPAVGEDPVEVDLDFTFPRLTPEDLIQGESVEVAPPGAPARALSNGGERSLNPNNAPLSEVFAEGTHVGFGAGYAYSAGHHKYTGNKGKVETTVYVSYEGTQIGTRTSFREEYVPYLLDFGRVKELMVEAYVFADQTCGLLVDGESKHYAEWQWFLGGPAPNWGPASSSTQAFPPMSQPACEPVPEPGTGGGNAGGGADGSGSDSASVGCWYWVTYDESTGEIVDLRFLFCDDVIGG